MDIEPVIAPVGLVEPELTPKPPEHQVMQLRAIVKVFVIEHSEGGWIDCGTGEFYLHNGETEEGKPCLRIRVDDKPDPAETREAIDPVKEKKLKGPNGDPKLLLDVPIQDGEEFMRCQSRKVLTSYHHQLGAEKHRRVYCLVLPLCLGVQGILAVLV